MIRLTRKEIYELVWKLPMTDIAKKYLISDVGFRKLCIRLNIPFPKLGDWAKMKAGHKISKPDLPGKWKGKDFAALKERIADAPVRQVSELGKLTSQIAHERLPFKVPGRLVRPDGLTMEAQESLSKLTDRSYPGMAVTAKGQLDIRVTNANIGRALRFMDTLIKCVRARGHRYEVTEHGNYVVVRQIRLRVNFRELTKKVKVQEKGYQDYQFQPAGKLVFRLDDRLKAQWGDLKSRLLEEQLPNVLAKLELVAKQQEEYVAAAREWQDNWERQRARQAERQERQKKEIAKVKALVLKAKQWKRAQLLREFLTAIPDPDPAWLSWAEQKANWFDPLVPLEDENLEGIDKGDLWK